MRTASDPQYILKKRWFSHRVAVCLNKLKQLRGSAQHTSVLNACNVIAGLSLASPLAPLYTNLPQSCRFSLSHTSGPWYRNSSLPIFLLAVFHQSFLPLHWHQFLAALPELDWFLLCFSLLGPVYTSITAHCNCLFKMY